MSIFIIRIILIIRSSDPSSRIISSIFSWNVILFYYILATLLPIDKLIGKLYPVFGIILIVMALSIAGAIIFIPDYNIPEITLTDLHPDNLPVWPFMFITVACGAISGFHATQSPMIAKCITSEKSGRKVFYGAMIIESVIALVWAAAGVAFYGGTQMLNDARPVMPEPIGDQYGLTVCLLDQVIQHFQFPVMDYPGFVVLIIDSAVAHLQELVRQSRSIPRIDIPVLQMDNEIVFQLVIELSLRVGHLNLVVHIDTLRHIQIVQCLHRNRDIADPLVDLILRSLAGNIGEHHACLSCRSGKRQVSGYGPIARR